MGYMKSDVDTRLLYIILGIGVVLVLLTILYQSSLGKINRSSTLTEQQLANAQSNMSKMLKELDMCKGQFFNLSLEFNDTKSFLHKSRDEYNVIYEETEGELQKTQEQLVNKNDQVTGLQQQNKVYVSKIAELENSVANLNADVEEAEKDLKKLEKYQKEADDFIDSFENCRKSNNAVSCYDAMKIPD